MHKRTVKLKHSNSAQYITLETEDNQNLHFRVPNDIVFLKVITPLKSNQLFTALEAGTVGNIKEGDISEHDMFQFNSLTAALVGFTWAHLDYALDSKESDFVSTTKYGEEVASELIGVGFTIETFGKIFSMLVEKYVEKKNLESKSEEKKVFFTQIKGI